MSYDLGVRSNAQLKRATFAGVLAAAITESKPTILVSEKLGKPGRSSPLPVHQLQISLYDRYYMQFRLSKLSLQGFLFLRHLALSIRALI